MIITTPTVDVRELARRTGWEVKPEGACRGDVCVPLPQHATSDGRVDARILAERLGMPLVEEPDHGLTSLGPAALGGRALSDARMPALVLPDLDGNRFAFSSLRGRKVLLIAWASW